MKKIKISFLFLVLVSGSLTPTFLHAQSANDSLLYYYNSFYQTEDKAKIISVYKYYEKHKDWSLKQNDTLTAIQSLRFLTIIQKKLGVFNDAESSAVHGLKLANNYSDTSAILKEAKSGLLIDLGIINRHFRNYENALMYYQKALKLTHKKTSKNIILNNIAYIYKEKKEYTKAYKFFDDVYKRSIESNDKKQIARSLSNLGHVKSKLTKTGGLNDLKKALEIRKNINHIPGIIASYLHLSEYYLDIKQNSKALKYAFKVLKIAKEKGNINYKLDALSLISQIQGNEYVLEYKNMIDSIAVAKQTNENKFAAMKYNFSEEKRKAEKVKRLLAEVKLKEEKQKRMKLIYLIIGLLILIVSIFSYYILKIRHKKEVIQQVYNTETRISKKVHDEVANDMFYIMSKLQNENINEKVIDELEEVYIKTRDISKENSRISTDGNFSEHLEDLFLSFNENHVQIITKNSKNINWEKYSDEFKTAIFRVIQELLVNMKKHSKASIVVINFNQTRNTLQIEYNDNGAGTTLKKLNGLYNAENRIKSIKGSIIFDSKPNAGFKVKITI